MAQGEVRYFLNEADKALLDEIVAWYLGRTPQSKGRKITRQDEGGQSRQVHIVYTPDGGIPALIRSGTTGTFASDAEDDIPGSAICEAYRLVDGRPRRTGVRILVYNFSDIAIPRAKWVKAARERWGSWIADTLWLEFGEC